MIDTRTPAEIAYDQLALSTRGAQPEHAAPAAVTMTRLVCTDEFDTRNGEEIGTRFHYRAVEAYFPDEVVRLNIPQLCDNSDTGDIDLRDVAVLLADPRVQARLSALGA